MQPLEPDYYTDENGNLVFTEHFLRRRGFCCGNGCRHCPYNYQNVDPERRAYLLQLKKSDEKKSASSDNPSGKAS
ncbi:MAG TPA: DUF5522 domain-containing protein [Ferruginibacter sp.]|jgi:hypothetical protein|nr:DUF5522 domain-containing protein [Ferruginibacter sp.]HRO06248.1 DUF5522 domain-containing protein [Ferruginibacter sp.]HRO96999.1 DUF5522 domain-containing protein [Ferruginibacter sp.]HRP49639.1 DUF5522 domain-containing protein [Ferruginibacter sp.]